MLQLRWTLGVVTAVAVCGWVALAAGGSGFRRSFGGSANPVAMSVVPLLVAAVVIASVVWPERRVLLHVTAAVMVLVATGAASLARETLFVATAGVLYATAWLLFYRRALRG